MTNPIYLPTAADDRRHQPGTDALRYWNESFWFPMYDPQQDIGVVFRSGAFPQVNGGESNLYLFILHRGQVVYGISDQHAALPPMRPNVLEMDNGLTIEWLVPLEKFRLRYQHGATGFDLIWSAVSPAFKYLHPPDTTVEQIPRHLEQGGRATGTVHIGGQSYPFNGFAHRDHSFGGDRDWDKFYRWTYLSGELDDFWFNAVRIKFAPEMDWIKVGCLWDGSSLANLHDVEMEVTTVDGGTRAEGVRARITDEHGRQFEIVSDQMLGIAPVRIWRTWLRDQFVRYRCGDRTGYGILEHGYLEDSGALEVA